MAKIDWDELLKDFFTLKPKVRKPKKPLSPKEKEMQDKMLDYRYERFMKAVEEANKNQSP